ncbi:MAG: DUF4118 domain-containing protein [Clostridiaceae bacterium]|nr:DUF4118 domain-containing protein [Clostridiales bacterium]MDD6876879.1 DUF4118 domain-containing protein [Clostridiaceae bacterium]MDY3072087.1 DUF4118 domain-containing protein [Eubacteriales bacterium]MDY3285778.1 DUF4118 domain-containing protein [Eubacteriales bacterium]MDY5014510.1 DUF4118 domain-containing protein [Eubacteriales bacterium]
MEEAGKRRWIPVLRDLAVTLLLLGAAIGCSSVLAQFFDDNNPFAAALFILAVALVSRYTKGYFYGVLASAIGVFCVNYMFTYPFWEFNMSISGYPLTFAVMLFVSIIISTLTTRIKRQEQLRFEVEKEKMRADLLRSVSHDLRTPLTSILGASSVLLEDEMPEESERQELIREIHKDAQWLIRVTENILSVTKISGGGVVLKKEEEVVEEIVGSAIVKFRKGADALPVHVSKPEQILLVPMEPTLISQVLINLFENAASHGETATRIDVKISCEQGRCIFAVEDDGAGIPPQVLPHIFDGNLSGTPGKNPDGRRSMGIGLSVCRSIIKAHGGDISAYNVPGGGAGIRFWLPCEGNV